MDAENIYENPPIYFGKDSDRENERLRRQRERAKKLLEATDSRNVTEMMVKLIYGDDFDLPVRMLDTKVECGGERVLELADGTEYIESYNDFRGKYVAEALRYMHKKGYVTGARFGREGSPVLYINPPYWENQASNYVQKQGYSPRKYTDSERESMYSAIERKLKSLESDELDRTEYEGVRAWWD